jgi:4-alpha-glucanotransferase
MSAGAPPDAFAEDGQNWGFPTYNWDKMAEDGYAWWCSRLGKMARYFDAYRIDHILGFFRIWEVPLDAVSAILGHFNPSMPYTAEEIYSFNPGWGFNIEEHVSRDMSSANALFLEYPYEPGRYFPRIEGYKTEHFQWLSDQAKEAFMRIHDDFYYRRHNDFWRDCAMKRLPALMASSSMLTCGEDLGMIPACVPDVMSSQRILSLEIQRMPKDTGVDFAYTWEYPYLSVAATSTHDMATIRGWWREDAELRQRYWNNILGFGGGAEWEMSGYTARRILELHMTSGSMLAILPLQDWLAIDEKLRRNDPDAERINVPANPNHYWRYRMHLTLEALNDAEEFNQNVKSLVDMR